MKPDPDPDSLTVDASYLADRFGLSPEAFRRQLKQRLIRSRVEVGQGEDAGKTRLTVRVGNRMWTAILDGNGKTVSEEINFVAARTSSHRR